MKRSGNDRRRNESNDPKTSVFYAAIAVTIGIFVVFLIIKLYMYADQGRLDSWQHLGLSYKDRITSMYEQQNPEKLEENPNYVDELLRKYKWRIPKLLSKLRRKYNLTEDEL